MAKESFRSLITESNEDNCTLQDIVEVLEKLDLSPDQLSNIGEEILENYVYFNDEIEFIIDDTESEGDAKLIGHDEDNTHEFDSDQNDIDDDNLGENEIYVYGLDDLDEEYIKVSKGIRMKNRRLSKKNRRKAVVKKDLKARGKKKCSDNQHVTKVSKGVYKCIAKDSASKKRGRRMKKFKKLYGKS